jgi:hypothetical protein
MSAHDHQEFVEGCYRCDLSRDEVAEHTPTTDEVRYQYGSQGYDSEFLEDMGLEFDRWYEAEKRRWQAEALRDVADSNEERADYLIDTMPDAFSGLSKERSQKREEAFELRRSANRLKNEADRIERGETA